MKKRMRRMRAIGNSCRSFLRRLFPRRRLFRDTRDDEVAGCWIVVVEGMTERGPLSANRPPLSRLVLAALSQERRAWLAMHREMQKVS
jgi:hypothetical protein